MLDARAGQLRLARYARDAGRLDGRPRSTKALGSRRMVGGDAFGFDPRVLGLDSELRHRLSDAITGHRRVLEGMTERGRRID